MLHQLKCHVINFDSSSIKINVIYAITDGAIITLRELWQVVRNSLEALAARINQSNIAKGLFQRDLVKQVIDISASLNQG